MPHGPPHGNRFLDLDPDKEFLVPPLGPTFLSKPKRPGFFQTLGQEFGQGFGRLVRGLQAVALPPDPFSGESFTERALPFIELPLGAAQIASAIPVAAGEKFGQLAERGALKTGIQTPEEAQRVGQAVNLGTQFLLPGGVVRAVPNVARTFEKIRQVKKAGGARGIVPMVLRSKQVRPLPEFEDIVKFGEFFKDSVLKAGKRALQRSGRLIQSGIRGVPPSETRSAEPLLKSIRDALRFLGTDQPGAGVFATTLEKKIGKLGPAIRGGQTPGRLPQFGFKPEEVRGVTEEFGELATRDIPARFRSGTLIESGQPRLTGGRDLPTLPGQGGVPTSIKRVGGQQAPPRVPETPEEVIESLVIELEKLQEGTAGGLTIGNVDFLRRKINSLLMDAKRRGIRVDKSALGKIRGGVEDTLDQFSDKFPRAVNRIKAGVKMFREKFVPFFERGTLLEDLTRKTPNSKAVERLIGEPLEVLQDVAKAIKKRETLDVLADSMMFKFKLDADELATGEFGLAKYLGNFSEEMLLKLKVLMSPDRFKDLQQVLPILKQTEFEAQNLLSKRSPFLFRAGIVQLVRGAVTASPTKIAGGINILVAPKKATEMISTKIGVKLLSQAMTIDPKSEKALTLALRINSFLRTAQRQQEQGQPPLLPEQLQESLTSQFLPPGAGTVKGLAERGLGKFFDRFPVGQ